ncbi:hypothetical protein HA402_012905 [Bradysia odoriphaga]|nr:hypothetical protein HA402_012905 [Bradysia odoriphaga]
MIRPSSLIRSESNTPRIEANAINIKKESLDCGITAMRCCNTPACQKLGTSTLFVTLLIIIGIILGASERYFQLSARQAAVELNFQPVEILDWLLVAHGIFQGIFAVVLAYWGNRIHRISWIGGILMLQSALSLAVVIPILANNDSSNMTIMAAPLNHLCTSTTSGNLTVERSYTITTLILFFILQFGIAGGNIVFFTLAFSYLDDNVLAHNSPALIGAALAARVWGWQFGSALNYGVAETSLGWWLGWAIISPTLFILAFLVSLFPKRLLTTVVRQAADNIIEVATNNSQLSLAPNKLLADISFFSSMKRMFTNKILIFNVLATVFIETAVINYFFHEKNYLQSRFLLPTDVSMSISNEWMSRTITTLLKPPIVGLMILVAGLIIAKANPSPRKIAAWNVITASIVCVLFVVYIFVECDHNYIAGGGGGGGKLMHPFCSKQCICDSNVPFSPVCPVDSVYTYFSPCHAGCSTETVLNGQRIFSNCSCGVDTMLMLNEESAVHATEGACGFTDCQQLWIIFQVLTIFGAALLGSGLIGNLIITIRCVLPQDKSLALSMELFLGGLIVYVPGKFAYQFIADEYCQYWSTDQQKCFLHESPTFGNILNIVTAALIGVSILFDILVFIFVRDLELYGEEIEDTNYRPIPMQTYASNENAPNQQASNAEGSVLLPANQ